MKVRKIIPSAPFIVGRETEEMLDCDLPRITQLLDEIGHWLFCLCTLGHCEMQQHEKRSLFLQLK